MEMAGQKRTMRTLFTGAVSNNHDYCIVNEVASLIDKGFICYLEEELWIGPSKTKRGLRAVVDIYAVKDKQEILVEVGTLSQTHGEESRLILLRKLKPNARILHIHQWKNYGITEDLIWRAGREWRRQIETWGKRTGPLESWWNGRFMDDPI